MTKSTGRIGQKQAREGAKAPKTAKDPNGQKRKQCSEVEGVQDWSIRSPDRKGKDYAKLDKYQDSGGNAEKGRRQPTTQPKQIERTLRRQEHDHHEKRQRAQARGSSNRIVPQETDRKTETHTGQVCGSTSGRSRSLQLPVKRMQQTTILTLSRRTAETRKRTEER